MFRLNGRQLTFFSTYNATISYISAIRAKKIIISVSCNIASQGWLAVFLLVRLSSARGAASTLK